MNIIIPKCYLQPRTRFEQYEKNSYSKIGATSDIFGGEILGYKFSETDQTYICIELKSKEYKLNQRLSDLADEIMDSKYILDLEDGWGENGSKIDEDIYFTAVDFIVSYMDHILEKHNEVIVTPEIKPVRNGSLDLVWNATGGYLAINIKKTEQNFLGTFFMFKSSNNKSIEGEVDLNEIDDAMALWMTVLK